MKITEQELKSIQEFKMKYDQLSLSLGRNSLQTKLIEADNATIHTNYNELVKQEQLLHDEIVKKYGPGNLDFKTGEYTVVQPEKIPTAGVPEVEVEEVK